MTHRGQGSWGRKNHLCARLRDLNLGLGEVRKSWCFGKMCCCELIFSDFFSLFLLSFSVKGSLPSPKILLWAFVGDNEKLGEGFFS